MTELNRRDFTSAAGALALLLAAPSGSPLAAAPARPDAGGWDLSDIFASDARWEAERKAVAAALDGIGAYKGKLGSGPGSLKAALTLASDLDRRALRLQTYAMLAADADLRVAANQERRQLASDLSARLDEATAWIHPEIASIGRSRLDGLMAADPGLDRFAFPLHDTLRRATHVLDGGREGILAAAQAPLAAPAAIQRQLIASNVPRTSVTLSDGRSFLVDDANFASLAKSRDRTDRKLVHDAYWSGYGKLEGALGATLAASVQGDVFQARARHHDTSLEAALFDRNIPQAVYSTMLDEVRQGLPVLQRYHAFRQRALKLPDLYDYDLTAPLASLDRSFTLAEARSLTLDAVAPLGRPYVEQLATATQARWTDPLRRPGKFPGSYCNPGAYDVHPYVLLNFAPSYSGVTAFAHEWGHAMHACLARKSQPFDTFNAPTFVQEVASTCNEQLLVRFMLRNAQDRQERLFYLNQQMENFAFVFFRQALRAEFEAAIHRQVEAGEALSGEGMTRTYHALLQQYGGPQLKLDPAHAIEWARQIQYYDAFYVFQYVTSITGGVHFARRILGGGVEEAPRYLAMLAAGGSDYGYDILRSGGLDLAKSEPYRALIQDFSDTIDSAEAIVG